MKVLCKENRLGSQSSEFFNSTRVVPPQVTTVHQQTLVYGPTDTQGVLEEHFSIAAHPQHDSMEQMKDRAKTCAYNYLRDRGGMLGVEECEGKTRWTTGVSGSAGNKSPFYSVCQCVRVCLCVCLQHPAGGHQDVWQGSPETHPTPINLHQFDLDSLKIKHSQFNTGLYLAEGLGVKRIVKNSAHIHIVPGRSIHTPLNS